MLILVGIGSLFVGGQFPMKVGVPVILMGLAVAAMLFFVKNMTERQNENKEMEAKLKLLEEEGVGVEEDAGGESSPSTLLPKDDTASASSSSKSGAAGKQGPRKRK